MGNKCFWMAKATCSQNWRPSCFPYLSGRSLHGENGFSSQAFRFPFRNVMSQLNQGAVTWPSCLSSLFPSFLLSFPPSSPFPYGRMCAFSVTVLEAGLLLSTGLMKYLRKGTSWIHWIRVNPQDCTRVGSTCKCLQVSLTTGCSWGSWEDHMWLVSGSKSLKKLDRSHLLKSLYIF